MVEMEDKFLIYQLMLRKTLIDTLNVVCNQILRPDKELNTNQIRDIIMDTLTWMTAEVSTYLFAKNAPIEKIEWHFETLHSAMMEHFKELTSDATRFQLH